MKRKASFIEGFRILSKSVGNDDDENQQSDDGDSDVRDHDDDSADVRGSTNPIAGGCNMNPGTDDVTSTAALPLPLPLPLQQPTANGCMSALTPPAFYPSSLSSSAAASTAVEVEVEVVASPPPLPAATKYVPSLARSHQQPQLHQPQQHTYIISIMVRGTITNNIADIWIKELNKHFPASFGSGSCRGLRVKASKQFILPPNPNPATATATAATGGSSTIAIVDPNCPLDKFLSWSKCRNVEQWGHIYGTGRGGGVAHVPPPLPDVALVTPQYGFDVMLLLRRQQQQQQQQLQQQAPQSTQSNGVALHLEKEFLSCTSRLCVQHTHPLQKLLLPRPAIVIVAATSNPNHICNRSNNNNNNCSNGGDSIGVTVCTEMPGRVPISTSVAPAAVPPPAAAAASSVVVTDLGAASSSSSAIAMMPHPPSGSHTQSNSNRYSDCNRDIISTPQVVAPTTPPAPTPTLTHPGATVTVAALDDINNINNSNPNIQITELLDKMVAVYTAKNDQWRVKSWKAASSTLKKMPRVTDVEQLNGLKTFGASARDAVQEILQTGRLKKVDAFMTDPKTVAIAELANIWGVGNVQAEKLYKMGYKSVADLRRKQAETIATTESMPSSSATTARDMSTTLSTPNPNPLSGLLSKAAQVGLDLYEDILARIPRSEMDLLYGLVKQHALALWPDCECICGGSYLRGASSCGDIDIIIFPTRGPDTAEPPRTVDIMLLIHSLTNAGFLTHHLSLPSGHGSNLRTGKAIPQHQHQQQQTLPATALEVQVGEGDEEEVETGEYEGTEGTPGTAGTNTATAVTDHKRGYLGVCKLSEEGSIYRRIDIKTYPRSQYPFAMLQWTGNDHFNRAMRYRAGRMGYHLTDEMLVRCNRDKDNKIVWQGECLPCVTEKDVFDILEMEWKEPWQRNGGLGYQPLPQQGRGNGKGNGNGKG